ncbi:MAG: cob(I)yrinic acid a,c-diamide adenosyltransferase [Syntrophales bacterium]|jgi:cob(I)alamin adenosyltransferase|nr:cob(I)yrinic acid a,c-diamide adenosyltransferase [Syntrophales bacterium]MCK9527064.1 cob(I)yrinic acid a,c-diamide adenosyltransferase [Syntrophales bacterium]MDX9921811.1 cob(I)yrinic acid a,c-diamide adenosyltransferase [Syntrophales bacterium]
MKLYTKRGDTGVTDLPGDKGIPKDDPRLEACGTLDELNAYLGLLHSLIDNPEDGAGNDLARIQAEVMDISTEAASSVPRDEDSIRELSRERAIALLEAAIDRMDASLPRLKGFIVPGGTPGASAAHVARTVCRRAERRLVRISRDSPNERRHREIAASLAYMNRLSDYLFALARYLNSIGGTGDRTIV